MSSEVNLGILNSLLSPGATITTPDADFTSTYANWTDYNLKIPLAVVKPAIENDILVTINFARDNSLRVSARGGGHSPFNTVEGGIVIDFEGTYAAVTYDEDSKTITVQCGAKNGDVLAVLAENDRCAMTGACNSVGFIPMYIAGGYGPLMPKLGLGIDNIISARLLLSTGEVRVASRTENSDIFKVIRGAGQVLGIVSELTVTTYPLAETVRSADGTVWSGVFALPIKRATDVADMLNKLLVAPEMAMYMAVTLPPPDQRLPATVPIIMLILTYFGSNDEADAAYAGIYDLRPVELSVQRVPYAQMNDGNLAYQQIGGFKRSFGIGLARIEGPALAELTKQVKELVNSRPDFHKTVVMFEMLGMRMPRDHTYSVYPYRSVRNWCCPTVWYTDPANHAKAEEWGVKARNTMESSSSNKIAVYTNFRSGLETAEELWGSSSNIKTIKSMKETLDPVTMFQSLEIL